MKKQVLITFALLFFNTLTLLPMKRGGRQVGQELMEVNTHEFMSQRIDHLTRVLDHISKRNKSKELKTVVPFSYLNERLKLAKSVLEKEPENKKLKASVDAFTQKAVAFYLNQPELTQHLTKLVPRDKDAQDLQIYDSSSNPFPDIRDDIPEDILVKSGYVSNQLSYLVDILKKFCKENEQCNCKKIVSPLHLALVIEGARKLIKEGDRDNLSSLHELIELAKKNRAQVKFQMEHAKNIFGERYSAQECKRRTDRLLEQYHTLSCEVKQCDTLV